MKKNLPLIIFLGFYFITISYKVITHSTPFYDWDESINVQVAKEMLENKSLVPLWQGNVWLDKPPFPFIFFGIIMKLTPFASPEISLRVTSLVLSIIALLFVYLLYRKVETFRPGFFTNPVAFLAVVITAFTPIFLQRAQILNLDVFLLIGWLGYLLFFRHFFLGFFFLSIGVLTKSLIGFYPVGILLGFYILLFLTKKIKKSEFKFRLKQIFIQVGILSFWYIGMLLLFGKDFWQQHIIETHFRRVTASIESHFGARTYYIDLMFEQLKWFFGFSVIGFSVVIWKFVHRKLTTDRLMYALFLFPWFIFLNLTKTKIFWYLYPAIPQFAFLATYPLALVNQYLYSRSLLDRFRIPTSSIGYAGRGKYGMTFLAITILSYIFYQNFIKTNFFTTFYSKPEDHYRLALYAKDKCESLTVLVGKETREATEILESMGLTITSTKRWGDHPSVVYYFGKKVNFYYDEKSFEDSISDQSNIDCFVRNKDDVSGFNIVNKFIILKNFSSFSLYKKNEKVLF